jgi:hypothetical protein
MIFPSRSTIVTNEGRDEQHKLHQSHCCGCVALLVDASTYNRTIQINK